MSWNMKMPESVRAYFQKQGRIGAAKRKANLTPEQRSEIARTAAEARWASSGRRGKESKGTK
jgi:hypothetical protein